MKWTFEQIEGPGGDRKKLELNGWNAPFGRPRKDPVIRELITTRVQTTRYPGSNKQTRHAFGTNWEPTELRGRWMTKNLLSLGKTAKDMADDWTAFVQDERTIRLAWGFILSFTGFITELELARESEDEIAWRMKLEIDQRDETVKQPKPSVGLAPANDNLEQIAKIFLNFATLQKPNLDDISPDFLESLDNLAALANVPSAELNKLAGRFDDIEKATFATIQHFRGAITGLRNAVNEGRDVILNATIDSVLLVRSAERDVEWAKYQCDYDAQTLLINDQLNRLDRKAELAQKNEATKFITAKEGDTWESLSTRSTGGPDKAGGIRSLNGARYGEQPEPGQSYLVQ